ncbi:MAG: DNA polymerase III subunit delta [Clostridiales Family XIII bacterium]|jgi:DNA polymerase-3 subunit delta|nr:DNA polymerase III subunit delta [Clostridiales Family XIII bacterium]
MAGGNRAETHAYKRIASDMAAGNLVSPLLLFGKEQFLVHWAEKAVIDKYVDISLQAVDLAKLDGTVIDVDAVVRHCETLPFGAEKRVVVVEDLPCVAGDGAKVSARFDEDAFLEYIGKLSDACMLILTATGADKRKKLYKAIAKNGGAYEFTSLDPPLLRSFTEKRFRDAGKRVSASVIRQFTEMTGYFDRDSEYTLYDMENDLKKLIAYCEGEEVFLSDVNAVMAAGPDLNAFALADAVSCGRRDKAFDLLSGMLASGESVYRLLALLISQFELLLSVREMMDRSFTKARMQSELGVHEYRLRMATEVAARFDTGTLREIMRLACETDKHIKTGLFHDALALELFVNAATGL